jgi:hypothetical protein
MKPHKISRLFAAALLAALFSALAFADPSTGLVVDAEGRVYFADERRNVVWKIGRDGRLTEFVTGRHSHRLALDAEGNVYGEHLRYLPESDSWEFHLWKATPDGEVSYVIPPRPGFPPGLLTDAAGNRYGWGGSGNFKRTSSLIEKLTPDGLLVTIAGKGWGYADGRGERARLGSIGGMAWGPDGALYVTDEGSVRRVTLDGEVTTMVRGGEELGAALWRRLTGGYGGGFGNHLRGLAVDGGRNVYLANSELRSVVKVSPRGQLKTVLTAEEGWSPTGVTVAGGDLYVLEHSAPALRVRKLDAEGRVTVLGVAGELGSPGGAAARTRDWRAVAAGGALVLLVAALLAPYWRGIPLKGRAAK